MACGKTVAFPARATPCKPSFHQLYAGMPRRGIAPATSCICETFSSRVMREPKSFTRCSRGRFESRNGARAGSFAAEEFGAVCPVKFKAKKNRNRNAARGCKNRLDIAKILSHAMPRVPQRLGIGQTESVFKNNSDKEAWLILNTDSVWPIPNRRWTLGIA